MRTVNDLVAEQVTDIHGNEVVAPLELVVVNLRVEAQEVNELMRLLQTTERFKQLFGPVQVLDGCRQAENSPPSRTVVAFWGVIGLAEFVAKIDQSRL